MADDNKTTPATESGTAAAAPAPKKAPKLGPIAKILADLDARIKGKREEVDALGKLKLDAQGVIQFAKEKKLSEAATVVLLREVVPTDAPKKAKAAKSSGGKARAKRVKKTAALVAKMKKMHKDGSTYEEIKAETGVGVQTIPKWLGKK